MLLGTYRIVLIFRWSKFSRIAVFDNFVEKISRIRCRITRSRRWCKELKIFVEIFSRMASNLQKSRKFRPTKYKRYTVLYILKFLHKFIFI